MPRIAHIAAVVLAAMASAVSVQAMVRPAAIDTAAIKAAQASFPAIAAFPVPAALTPQKPRAHVPAGPRLHRFVPTQSVHRVLLTRRDPAFQVFHTATTRPAAASSPRPQGRPLSIRRLDGIAQGRIIPTPPTTLEGSSALGCIAVAIYHEARDQETLGQRAVASVILQRAAVPGRWGERACDVVTPVQFSFLTGRYTYAPITNMKAWAKATQLAAQALLRGPLPELEHADHYHTTDVRPAWAGAMVRVRTIDDHIFYADPMSVAALR